MKMSASSISSSCFTIGNPKISPPNYGGHCWKKTSSIILSSSSSSVDFPHSSSSCTPVLPHKQSCKLSLFGLGQGLPSLHPLNLKNRSAFPFASSHEDSKPLETEDSQEYRDTPIQGNESEEYWNQTLAFYKEQALKMQSVSQEAYEEYSKRAIVILNETFKQLNIQAEKAKTDLSVIAEEVSKEGKQYLSTSPEPVKEIVETFASSSTELNDISQISDFYIGIPYGFLLSFGGFLSFMMTGSTSAIRFGVILGGALLALGVLSLRSWKRGESSSMALGGQTAIASILFLREIRILFASLSFTSFLTTLVSGAMAVFFINRLILGGKHTKGSNLESGNES